MTDTEKNQDTDTDANEAAEAEPKKFESEIETVGPCKVEVRIKVPVETIQKELDDRYREIIKTVAFPGFRVGHAPRRLVEKRLGDEVMSDLKDGLVADSFKEAIETHGLEAIDEPDLDLENIEVELDKPLEYKTVLLVRPTVELPDPAAVTVKAAKVEVTDDMVQDTIQDLRRRHAVMESVAGGKMEDGDIAILDVVARVGDEKVLDRENVEYHHPAEHVVGLPVKSLKDDLLGKGRDDEFTVTQTLPETWPEESQAGKEMLLEIRVCDVKRGKLPELDAAFAEELDYDSVEEIEEEVRNELERGAERESQKETDREIVDALLDLAPFDLPEDVVKEEITRRIDHKRTMLRMQCADEEELEEKLAGALIAEKADVEREFKAGFLLSAFAKEKNVFVTENEVEDRIAQMAAGYNRSAEEMKEYLEQREMIGSIRSGMKEEKVMDYLRKKVKIEEAE